MAGPCIGQGLPAETSIESSCAAGRGPRAAGIGAGACPEMSQFFSYSEGLTCIHSPCMICVWLPKPSLSKLTRTISWYGREKTPKSPFHASSAVCFRSDRH